MVVLVGTTIGAGRPERAKRIAWIGTAFAASISLAIGPRSTLVPLAWVGLFSSDPAVLESGSLYLRTVAPFYSMLAANIALYFASQGAGKVLRPVLAGTARLADRHRRRRGRGLARRHLRGDRGGDGGVRSAHDLVRCAHEVAIAR